MLKVFFLIHFEAGIDFPGICYESCISTTTFLRMADQERRHGCFRKLPQMVNKLKIDTSANLKEESDEEVEIYGKPNSWHLG